MEAVFDKAQCLFELNRYEEVISCLDMALKLEECSELDKKWGLEYQANAYFRITLLDKRDGVVARASK